MTLEQLRTERDKVLSQLPSRKKHTRATRAKDPVPEQLRAALQAIRRGDRELTSPETRVFTVTSSRGIS